MVRRYAIYAAPREDGPLWWTANRWLGRDPLTGDALDPPAVAGLDPDRAAKITESPRLYGFHGTLKPPFLLAPGTTEADLIADMADFAAGRAPVLLASLAVARLGGFVALTCTRACPAIDDLAAACVERFDRFRRPMTPRERARRAAADLTPRQEAHLDRWGYPYVFDEYRFHMTLTGRLDPAEREATISALAALFAAVDLEAVTIDSICLFEQASPGAPFLISRRFDLSGS